MTRVGIIIVTWNSKAYLEDLLASLKIMDTQDLEVSFIFVDNHSSDDTVQIIKNEMPYAHIIQTYANLGFSEGNNRGYAHARTLGCQYVYLLNHDTIVEPDFLVEAVTSAKANPQAGAVQSHIRLYPETHELNMLGNMTQFIGYGYTDGEREPISLLNQDQEVTYTSGAGVLLNCQVIEKVGLFESDFFMYAEDQDLCWRMQLMGYTVMVSAKSVIYHKYSFTKSMKQYFFMERNRLLVLLLNYKWKTILLILPIMLAFDGALFIYSLFSGFWKKKVSVYAYFMHPFHWKWLLERREKRQSRRIVSDRVILRRFSGGIYSHHNHHPILDYILNPLMNVYFFLLKRIVVW